MFRLTFNLVILILSFYIEVVYFINKLGWRQYVGFVVFGEIKQQMVLWLKHTTEGAEFHQGETLLPKTAFSVMNYSDDVELRIDDKV